MRLVVGITGASGAIYGIRLLEILKEKFESEIEVHLILSESAKKIIELETDIKPNYICGLASTVYKNDNLEAPVSSGSYKFEGAVIIPCSAKTLSSIANGFSDSLISRVADVCLKEERKLVLVPRETPLNLIYLENMLKVKKAGATILPASPAFYHNPKEISDLIDFIVGRILDCYGVEHDLFKRWGDGGIQNGGKNGEKYES